MMDGLGNVIGSGLDGSSGAAILYDAWGNVETDSTAMMRLNTLRFGYKGMLYDETTGLYNARARWYDPEVGRFISEDPIGLGGGMNQYAFAGNDPINGSDPSGLLDPGCTVTIESSGAENISCTQTKPVGGSPNISFNFYFGSSTPPWMQGSNPAMALFGQFVGGATGGNPSAKAVANAAGKAGLVAGLAEVAGDSKRLSTVFTAAADIGKVGRVAGDAFFLIGAAADLRALSKGNETPLDFFANTGVGLGAALVGGPVGLGIGAAGYGIDHTVGWSRFIGCAQPWSQGFVCF